MLRHRSKTLKASRIFWSFGQAQYLIHHRLFIHIFLLAARPIRRHQQPASIRSTSLLPRPSTCVTVLAVALMEEET